MTATAVVTATGAVYQVRAAVVATGTYLGGRTIVGDVFRDSGPDGLQAALALTGCGEETLLDKNDPVTVNFWHVYGEQSGSPMDVLVQEFNREVNTIGSKGSDLTIAGLVVEAKSEIEKLREQVQNIE